MEGHCVFVVQIILALTLQATLSLKKIESYMFFSTVCSFVQNCTNFAKLGKRLKTCQLRKIEFGKFSNPQK